MIIVVLIIEYIGFHIAVLNVDTSKKQMFMIYKLNIYNIKEKPLNIGHNNSKVLDKVNPISPEYYVNILYSINDVSKSGLTKVNFLVMSMEVPMGNHRNKKI